MAASTRDFYIAGNQLVGHSGKGLGSLLPGGPEDLRFRSNFGCPVALAARAWSKMIFLCNFTSQFEELEKLSDGTHVHVYLSKKQEEIL
jgi:hypothetical protein